MFTGVFLAIALEVLRIPVMPFAIGLYLPIYLSVPMILGGALRWYLEKRKCGSEKEKNDSVQSGVLYSSGLIAGEGIVGILLAVLVGAALSVSGASYQCIFRNPMAAPDVLGASTGAVVSRPRMRSAQPSRESRL